MNIIQTVSERLDNETDAISDQTDQGLALLSLSGAISGDRFIYHDILLRSMDGGQTYALADHQRFRHDSAEMEFLTYPLLFIVFFCVMGMLAILGIIVTGSTRRVSRRLRVVQG